LTSVSAVSVKSAAYSASKACEHMGTKKAQFLRGLKAAVPVILGFIPIGIAYAIIARQAGLSVVQTTFMSAAVLAGAAQMMAAGMVAQGSSIITIVIATFILNLRHLIMSTCVMNRMKPCSVWLRMLASFGVTDESFAVFTTESDENSGIMFFLGLFLGTYIAWIGGSFIGSVFSSILPEIVSASLGIALYAMFIGLLLPGLRGNSRLLLLAIITAGLNSIFCLFMASSWALIAATLLGAFIGVFFVELEEESEDTANEQH